MYMLKPYLLTTFPLILVSGFTLIIQKLIQKEVFIISYIWSFLFC